VEQKYLRRIIKVVKTKINKLLGVLVVVMLLGSLTVGLAVPAAAADGSWSVLNTPQVGPLGNYIMVPTIPGPPVTSGLAALNFTSTGPYTNDVGPSLLTKNKDGSILYVNWDINEGAQGSNLYKSTDGGRTWIRCSNTTDDLGDVQITQIVTSPQDANRVYVVTDEWDPTAGDYFNQIYRSTDAGANFTRIVTPTDEEEGALPIYSLAVGYNGSHYLYAATRSVKPAMSSSLMTCSAVTGNPPTSPITCRTDGSLRYSRHPTSPLRPSPWSEP